MCKGPKHLKRSPKKSIETGVQRVDVSTEYEQVPKAPERSLDWPYRSCSAVRRKKLENIWKHYT